MTVKILVATQGGTADLCAQEIVDTLADRGIDAEATLMGDFGPEVFDEGGQFIICTSTYGYGEIPDNGTEFYEALVANKPDLSRVSFAVFGLGDMTYEDTFNFAGQKFDTILAECGAERVIERHIHDANSGNLAEDEAIEWIEGWISVMEAKAAA
ncbi:MULTISPECIES: flavodoxin domain-containing protein [Nisaea]|jgi:MioC protein|uniref:flavodoxin domain-containing protein n=1 Tax=Nisaea TaxID=390876 RepID=UPI0018688A0D|nr:MULTISPECIES: flavodoxin domain-containing protein [Nisaea]MBO6559402.1 flavodoxin domain-containing protein [Nisaea sp.]